MDYLFCTIGTLGDLFPILGIAARMRKRGHETAIHTHAAYRAIVEKTGVGFIELDDEEDRRRAVDNPMFWHPTKGGKLICAFSLDRAKAQFDAIASHYVPGRTVVAAPGPSFGARLAQDKLGVPTVTLHISPSNMMSAVDPPSMQYFHFPRWFPSTVTRLIFQVGERLFADPMTAPRLNEIRAELGLPPVRKVWLNWQHSPQQILGLFPDWFAPPPSDWPSQLQLTGFPINRDVNELPAPAREFLDAGDPPVIFTSPSEGVADSKLFSVAVEACRRLGRRGLLLARKTDAVPANLPDTIRHFEFLPLRETLARSAAIVTHGGIGSVALALEAGVPQLLIPRACDQFDNSRRVERLGGGLVLKFSRRNAESLARKLDQLLTSSDIAMKCADFAKKARAADGIDVACDALEAFAQRIHCGESEIRASDR